MSKRNQIVGELEPLMTDKVIAEYEKLTTDGFLEDIFGAFLWTNPKLPKDLRRFLNSAFGKAILSKTEAARRFNSRLFRSRVNVKTKNEEDAGFFLLIGATHNIKHPLFRERISQAIAEDDASFFVDLGRVLKAKPFSLSKTEKALLVGWDKWVANVPALCFFTNSAVVDFLQIVTGNSQLSEGAVRKGRERLGLKGIPQGFQFVRGVERRGGKLFWTTRFSSCPRQ
jgi:hypothetical protein